MFFFTWLFFSRNTKANRMWSSKILIRCQSRLCFRRNVFKVDSLLHQTVYDILHCLRRSSVLTLKEKGILSSVVGWRSFDYRIVRKISLSFFFINNGLTQLRLHRAAQKFSCFVRVIFLKMSLLCSLPVSV